MLCTHYTAEMWAKTGKYTANMTYENARKHFEKEFADFKF